MERLTKTELRALLECIKECYLNSDLESFTQRLVSRLAKIFPADIISDNGVIPRRRRNSCATQPQQAYPLSRRKPLEGAARISILHSSQKAAGLRQQYPTTFKSPSPASRGLSPRESQVLHWVSQGKTNKEIGVILGLSARTVQKHLEHIYQKLGVETRTGAAAKAYGIASNPSTHRVSLRGKA